MIILWCSGLWHSRYCFSGYCNFGIMIFRDSDFRDSDFEILYFGISSFGISYRICFKSLNPCKSVFKVVLRSWSWNFWNCYLELDGGEVELLFEEDGNWLEHLEVFGRIESAYEVGRWWFCESLRSCVIGDKVDWEERAPDEKRCMYWAGLYLSYNWEYVFGHFCYFNGHFFVTWSGLPHVRQLGTPGQFQYNLRPLREKFLSYATWARSSQSKLSIAIGRFL